jgi:transcriptional regulator with PAS, ATPase and Fis domain
MASDEETLQSGDRGAGLALRVVLADRVITRDLPAEGSIVLGRDPRSDVVIDHRSVSRSHARITVRDGNVTLRDLGSANGTVVADVRLEPERDAPVQPGDAIELGDVVVLVQRGRIAAPKAPPASTRAASMAMKPVDDLIARVAPGMINVLIVGETGAGKEVVAERIHRRSRRAGKPFVRLNCAAVAEPLLESEWFGHERGAFTGAIAAKPGLIESAEGGTVLLDEIGELPLGLQAKLLRVIEERTVLRVGGVKSRVIDVRFLAATNRDLAREVEAKTFRQDLYFRLNGVTITVPPLRDRREEIEPLALQFVAAAAASAERERTPALTESALEVLRRYDWPGNVRELRNAMERAVLLCDEAIGPESLPESLRGAPAPASTPAGQSLRDAVADVEKQRVLAALAQANGNQKRAAEILGIARGTLLARLDAFGIPRPRKQS